MWTVVWIMAVYAVGSLTGAYMYAKTLRARFLRISAKVLEEISSGRVKEGRDVHIEVIGERDAAPPAVSGGDQDAGC